MPWDEGIEGPVWQIAATHASSLCVVAGPGTGKTFALMRRLARLLEVEGVNPQQILACTFTRTAAEDVSRAVASLGVSGVEDVATSTVHGLCFSMLMKQSVLAITGRVPRTLLQYETRFLLEDTAGSDLGGVRECGKSLRAFSAAWARLQHEEPGWPKTEHDRQFQALLNGWLRFHQAMLIGELIPEGIKYLRANPTSSYRTMFKHVLVDEYQDLNRAEQAFIDLIAAHSLVVIGDEDQSIYSFKHAHPEGIVQFPQSHPDTQETSLSECRRCPRVVVEMANRLIEKNSSRSMRRLVARPQNPDGDVFVVQWLGMQEEADGLASFIAAKIDRQEVVPGKILVLAPRREFGNLIRDALLTRFVPAHSFYSEDQLQGNPKSTAESQAQQAVTLLNLIADPEDRVSLRCWSGFGSSSLLKGAWSRLRQHCEESGESPWKALEKLVENRISIPRTGALVSRFKLLLQEIERRRDLRGNLLLDAIFPSNEAWAAPLIQIGEEIDDEEFDASTLAAAVRRNVSQPELPIDVDYVRIMSLHKSKGLTADLVVICGCIEGLLPAIDESATLLEQERSLQEQRRLFYVGITRTTRTLVLSSITAIRTRDAKKMYVRTANQWFGTPHTITSRFISDDLGPTCPHALTGDDFLKGQLSVD